MINEDQIEQQIRIITTFPDTVGEGEVKKLRRDEESEEIWFGRTGFLETDALYRYELDLARLTRDKRLLERLERLESRSK